MYVDLRACVRSSNLARQGLHASGVGGTSSVTVEDVAPLEEYERSDGFDLIVLATKAREAIEIAPRLIARLRPQGTLLPIQNGGVAEMLATRFGASSALGGISTSAPR